MTVLSRSAETTALSWDEIAVSVIVAACGCLFWGAVAVLFSVPMTVLAYFFPSFYSRLFLEER